MNFPLFFSLAATVLTTIVFGVYWCVVYPILRLKLRFALRQIRDELRLGGIAGEYAAESRVFLQLKRLANAAVSVSEHASEFTSLPSETDSAQVRFEISALVEELDNSPKQLRDIGHEIINRTFALYLSQRPLASLAVAALLIAALVSAKAKRSFKRWLSASVAETAIAADLHPVAA